MEEEKKRIKGIDRERKIGLKMKEMDRRNESKN